MEGSEHFQYTSAQKEVEAKAEKCDKVCNFYKKKLIYLQLVLKS